MGKHGKNKRPWKRDPIIEDGNCKKKNKNICWRVKKIAQKSNGRQRHAVERTSRPKSKKAQMHRMGIKGEIRSKAEAMA